MTALCLGVDCGTKALGLALVEMEPPHLAVWAERASIDERDAGWRYQQVGNALRQVDAVVVARASRAEPRPDCENCDGRGCMGCVFREYDHDCVNDCPMCCAGRTLPDEIVRGAIEVPPFVNNNEVYAQLREVFALVGAEAHRRWPWAPQISANVSTWKQAVLGNGKATKAQVMEWADDALGRDAIPELTQDAADALAIATYGAGVELVEEAA